MSSWLSRRYSPEEAYHLKVCGAWERYRAEAHAEWNANRPWIDFGDQWTAVALEYWSQSLAWTDAVTDAKGRIQWMTP